VRLSGVNDFGSIGLYQFGLKSYDTSRIYGLSGQISSLMGGIAGAAYDRNYSLGAYGANQVITYNDESILRKESDDKIHREYGVPTNNPDAVNADGLS